MDLELNKLLQNKEYSLNVVSHYGDNLLHVSAANGCTMSVQTILNQNENCYMDRKNKFGWTPLMHAVRANKIKTVKVLLKNGADVTQRTYLGMSMLSLAAGISQEMFEIVYKACPFMLENSVNDDITPLCIAAMRNDKNLFFKLLNLGLEVKNESIYTHLVMQQSIVPEIKQLAQPQLDTQDYWNDRSNSIPIRKEFDNRNESCNTFSNPMNDHCIENTSPLVLITSPKEKIQNFKQKFIDSNKTSKKLNFLNLDLLSLKESTLNNSQSISPNLIYNLDSWFAKSPNLCNSLNSIQSTSLQQAPKYEADKKLCYKKQQNQRNVFTYDEPKKKHSPPIIASQRTQDINPSDSKLDHDSIDLNITLTFTPEFSPSRSPYLPSDYEDEDVYGEDTPTPPPYKTPPQGIILNSEQTKLVITLKQFDMEHYISTFLTEEVDMSLFLTLNDQDLTEIGIANEQDRKALLAIIDAYTKDNNH